MIIIQLRDDKIFNNNNYNFMISDENGCFYWQSPIGKHHASNWYKLNFNTIYGSLIKSGESNE